MSPVRSLVVASADTHLCVGYSGVRNLNPKVVYASSSVVHVAPPRQHQNVPSVSDTGALDVQLSMCERMFSHTKAYLLPCLALGFVDRDRVTRPE